MVLNSLQSLENSEEGRVTIELYSVSGIPSCSESNDKRLRLNSEILSYSGFYKGFTIVFEGESNGSGVFFCLHSDDIIIGGTF
jgi:hypothetical protein